MRISEKQLQALMVILKDSINQNIVGIFSLTWEDRRDLINEIVNQQSDVLIDVEGDKQIES